MRSMVCTNLPAPSRPTHTTFHASTPPHFHNTTCDRHPTATMTPMLSITLHTPNRHCQWTACVASTAAGARTWPTCATPSTTWSSAASLTFSRAWAAARCSPPAPPSAPPCASPRSPTTPCLRCPPLWRTSPPAVRGRMAVAWHSLLLLAVASRCCLSPWLCVCVCVCVSGRAAHCTLVAQ